MAALQARAPLLLPLLLLAGATVHASEAEKVIGGKKERSIEEVAEKLIEFDNEAEVAADGQYWSPACPVDFQKYWSAQNIASVCFHVSSTKRSWLQARTACINLAATKPRCHGDLASVMNASENEFISNLLYSSGDRDHAWIGLTDSSYESWFRWIDRRQSSWTNFYVNEPNDGGNYGNEDCVELMYGYGGRWNDRNCNDQKYYVCKAYCV